MTIDWNAVPRAGGEPDFENLAAVLRGEVPSRPTLFEFYMNGPLYARLAGAGTAGTGSERNRRCGQVPIF